MAGRRLFSVAVIDCPDAPNNKKNMPAAEPDGAVDVFFTEPMGGFDENNFYAEIVGPSGNTALSPSTARKRVILYE